jgi:peptidoglycan/LPS O-acetylase OafA/YrhL
VRALAAYLVFFHHNQTPWLEAGPLVLWWELHIGVTLFFVLSGFVITWRYDRRGPKRESYFRDYAVNRVARIFPLYVVLVIPSLLHSHQRSPVVWLLNLTIFTDFGSGIPQAWSLRVEECFYLVAPLVFWAWRRRPGLPFAVGAAVLAVLVPVSRLPSLQGILGPPANLFLYTFFGRFFEFFVGVWLARRVMRVGIVERPARRFPLFTLAGGLGIAGIVAALAAIHTATRGRYLYGVYHPAGIALNNFVLPLLIAAFYWGLVQEPTGLRRLLSTRLADLLGRSSYAFYLVHFGVAREYVLSALVFGATLLSASAGAAVDRVVHSLLGLFVLVNLLAILLYKTIEAPANRFLRRAFASRPTEPAA